MDYKLQLLSLLISFIYGILFSLLTNFNYKCLYKTTMPLKILFNIIFILDIVLLYTFIIYKINKGIFHIYFILMILMGYMVSFNKVKTSIKRIKKKRSVVKTQKKWYCNYIIGEQMKKVSKKAKRRIFVLTIILISIIGFLGASVYKYWLEIFENVKRNKELHTKYEVLLKEETELQAEAKKLEDLDYVAKYARENYLFSKDGEKIIRVVE